MAEELDFDAVLDALGLSHLKPAIAAREKAEKAAGGTYLPAAVEDYEKALAWAREKIESQKKELQRLVVHPFSFATVLAVNQDTKLVTLSHEGRIVEVGLPENKNLAAGDAVKVLPKTTQIIDTATLPPLGPVATIRRVVDDTFSEVEVGGSARVVLNGKFTTDLEAGDRVTLDSGQAIILSKQGRDEDRFRFGETINVTWNDIAGLEEAKDALREAIEFPYTHEKLFKSYHRKPIKGILLYGPPGCGKTMLAKAVANSISSLHGNGKGAQTAFLYIRGPEILDRYVGAAEATIRQIFKMARAHKEEHGYPAIVFIDEAEAILYKRGTGKSSDVERTIVPMFLAEMDGLEDSGAIVLLATNREDTLDSAVVRENRVDYKVKVTRPTKETAPEFFRLYLKKALIANGTPLEEIVVYASEELFSERHALYEIATRESFDETPRVGDMPANASGKILFTLGSVASGSMIAGVVSKASSLAFHRDRKAGNTEGSGITKEDIRAATEKTFASLLEPEYGDDLVELIGNLKEKFAGIKSLRQTTA